MRQTPLHRRPGALHAIDMVQLQHYFNRSIPFYMLLSDTREGGVVPRSTAEMDAEDMGLGMLHSVWQREELLRVRPVDRAPLIRLSRTIASSVDDCDAYDIFRVLEEDMACLEDIKTPWLPITFTATDPRAAPLLFIVVVAGAVVFPITPGNRTAVGAGCFRSHQATEQ